MPILGNFNQDRAADSTPAMPVPTLGKLLKYRANHSNDSNLSLVSIFVEPRACSMLAILCSGS
jgi:hypothetical protein